MFPRRRSIPPLLRRQPAELLDVKFMLSAVLAGMVGVYLLMEGGVDRIMVLPTVLGANAVVGGIVFLRWIEKKGL